MNGIPKLRPGILGLLLGFGVHGAGAAVAQDFALVQARATDNLPASVRRNLPVAAPAAAFSGSPLIFAGDPARLMSLTVDHRILGAIRDGVGVNFSMGDLGGLHLNLYSRRNPKGPGQRWNLNPAGPGAAAALPQLWSLGGTLDLVRDNNGSRQIALVPQLLLNFDALGGSPNGFQAFVQYANWRPAAGEARVDEKVPQIALRLRY